MAKPKPQTPDNPAGGNIEERGKEKGINSKGMEEIKKIAKEQQQAETRKLLKLDKEKKENVICIKKAKITSNNTLDVEYISNGDTITIKRKAIIHPDLKKAFEELVPHFAMLCDLKEVKKLAAIFEAVNLRGLANLRVTSVSLGGGEPSTGCIITGIKQINNNKQIVINSPWTEFDSENEPYSFSGYLAKSVAKLKDEVIEYLNGKQGEEPQQKLELSADDEELLK